MGIGLEPQSMRNKALRFAAKRKEEYIGARVPKSLKEKIILQAKDMNIPVSLLVRKALEKVFLEDNLAAVIQDFVDQDTEKKPTKVTAWSKIEIAQPCQCEGCGEQLAQGQQAYLPIGMAQEDSKIFCESCKQTK